MTVTFENLYAPIALACYEGEEDMANDNAGDDNAMDTGDAGDDNAGDDNAGGQGDQKLFTQAELNRFMAEDRRKHQEQAKQLADKAKKLEAEYKKMLADKKLDTESRQKLEMELENLQASQRTKEQQIEYERKQSKERYEKDLTATKEASMRWESLYKSTVIDRAIQDAAISAEAFNPSQVIDLLKPFTKMVEQQDPEGNPTGELVPVIDFKDIDEKTGERITTLRTPIEAIQRMKELPNVHGNLFKPNVVSGVGAGSATGGATPGSGSRVDPSRLSTEQYFKLRAENPEALGLKRRTNAR